MPFRIHPTYIRDQVRAAKTTHKLVLRIDAHQDALVRQRQRSLPQDRVIVIQLVLFGPHPHRERTPGQIHLCSQTNGLVIPIEVHRSVVVPDQTCLWAFCPRARAGDLVRRNIDESPVGVVGIWIAVLIQRNFRLIQRQPQEQPIRIRVGLQERSRPNRQETHLRLGHIHRQGVVA